MNKIIAIKVSSNKESQECIEELKKYGVPVCFGSLIVPSYGYICICYDNNTFEYFSSFAAEADNLNEDIERYEYSDIEFFKLPDEIKEKMVSRTKQKNCIGFIIYLCAGSSAGGFTWDDSEEGDDFWRAIIQNKQFDIFFTKYPKSSAREFKVKYEESLFKSPVYSTLVDEYKKALDELINNNFNFKDYESRLQKQETHLSGRDGAKSVRFHGGKHQVRIASKHLSYQKAVGRG